jgi:hypothetical protein
MSTLKVFFTGQVALALGDAQLLMKSDDKSSFTGAEINELTISCSVRSMRNDTLQAEVSHIILVWPFTCMAQSLRDASRVSKGTCDLTQGQASTFIIPYRFEPADCFVRSLADRCVSIDQAFSYIRSTTTMAGPGRPNPACILFIRSGTPSTFAIPVAVETYAKSCAQCAKECDEVEILHATHIRPS